MKKGIGNKFKSKVIEEKIEEDMDIDELEAIAREVEKDQGATNGPLRKHTTKRDRTWNNAQLKIIGKFVQNIRREKGVTQTQFEKRFTQHIGYCSNLENGKVKGLDLKTLSEVASYLKFELKPLLEQIKDITDEDIVKPSGKKFKRMQTNTMRLDSEDETLSILCNIDFDSFSIGVRFDDEEYTKIYEGPKDKNSEFFDLMEEAIKHFKKSF